MRLALQNLFSLCFVFFRSNCPCVSGPFKINQFRAPRWLSIGYVILTATHRPGAPGYDAADDCGRREQNKRSK